MAYLDYRDSYVCAGANMLELGLDKVSDRRRSDSKFGATALHRRSIMIMSPTLFRDGSFRYFFFSGGNQNDIHVSHPDAEAKF